MKKYKVNTAWPSDTVDKDLQELQRRNIKLKLKSVLTDGDKLRYALIQITLERFVEEFNELSLDHQEALLNRIRPESKDARKVMAKYFKIALKKYVGDDTCSKAQIDSLYDIHESATSFVCLIRLTKLPKLLEI